ncbi:MAG TPA: site-specific integrase [Propionicimonas sp.]|jgi:integrase
MASIAKRGDVYRARYRDQDGREHAGHFSKKGEAQRWLDEQTAAIVTGQWADPKAGRVTWAAFCADWMARQAWVPGTLDAATTAVESVPWAIRPIGEVKPSHVQAWVAREHKRGLAPSTIRTRLNYVQMAFRAATLDKLIPSSPAIGVKPPRTRRAEAAMKLLTAEQVAAALAAADESFGPFIAVCAFAGLRLGEAAGLQLGDVDFLRRSIAVARQVQGSSLRTTTTVGPKAGSERVVYVPEALTQLLAAHVADQGVVEPDAYLFRRITGELWQRNSAGAAWRKVRATVGATVDEALRATGVSKEAAAALRAQKIPDGATLHALRHTFASALIADGCDVVTVQRALGHSSPSITLNVYSHLWPSAEDRTRSASAAFMASVLTTSADSLRTPEVNDEVRALGQR